MFSTILAPKATPFAFSVLLRQRVKVKNEIKSLLLFLLCANPAHSYMFLPFNVHKSLPSMLSQANVQGIAEWKGCSCRLKLAASQRGLRRRPAMFTRLSNTHTVCLSQERDSLGLGCLHQHISNVLRPAFLTHYNNTKTLSRDTGKSGEEV